MGSGVWGLGFIGFRAEDLEFRASDFRVWGLTILITNFAPAHECSRPYDARHYF